MVLPLLAVRDIDASLDFYTRKLGFSLQFMMPGASGTAFAMIQWGDKTTIGLTADPLEYDRGKGAVFMIYVPDGVSVNLHHAEVSARGAQPGPIEDQYWGDRSYTVVDPDGFLLMISQTITQMSPDDIIASSSSS